MANFRKITILIIAAFLFSSLLFSQAQIIQSNSEAILPSPNGAAEPSTEYSAGLNYLSLYNMYSEQSVSREVLTRDFYRFKADGLSIISLSLYWYRLEGDIQGIYNGTNANGNFGDTYLSDVKQVITTANQCGLKVLVTLHTLWGNDSQWCTPKYVNDPITGKNIGLAIVRSNDIKNAYINMFNHTVNYLARTPGIWAWAILNEPWYWGQTAREHDFITSNGQTQKENFIYLIQDLSSIVKTEDGRLVTVKFISSCEYTGNGTPRIKNIFADDWTWDARILNSLDFLSFDTYLKYPEQESTWRNITTSNIIGCQNRNKQVWITEFGVTNDNDALQVNGIASMVAFYKSLSIQGWIAWLWEGDTAPLGWDQNPAQFGKGYNLCASSNGNPRPAYYILR